MMTAFDQRTSGGRSAGAAGDHGDDGDDARVDIRILGPLDVTVGGRAMALGGARNRRLFALLATNANAVVPFDRIVEVLWDDPPDSARQSVHNVVGDLRRILAGAGGQLEVTTDSVGYQLDTPALAVDAVRFQSGVHEAEQAESAGSFDEAVRLLQQALGQWHGPALSGLTNRRLTNTATHLNEQRLTAAEHLAELQLSQGDAATAVGDLIELVAENPFRESLRAILMKALHESGRQADALAAYEEGRRLLAEELGLDPGPLLRDAHRQILQGARPDRPDARPKTAAPGPEKAGPGAGLGAESGKAERCFLPRDIVEFTGRDAEVRRLVDGAKQAGTTALVISAIDGMGGVGKTTLAVHLAHQIAGDYPDGQYFVDLLGFSAGTEPLSPLQALHLLLRNSGMPPELIPADLAERSALWRSRLAGQRVVLLLDNAADTAQVRPLLPGAPGTLVLISSRRRMTSLEGAVPLSLDVMPKTEATALFRQIIGSDRADAEPDAVSRAVELCGHLPLAIQVAAARLRDRTSWAVADLVNQLQSQHGRARFLAVGDRDVMSVLAWSYRHLTQRQQVLFRLLCLHPGPDFDAYAAAALAGTPLDDAEACLEELFDVNLLQQHAPGRYRFHDLVRDCSLGLLEQHNDQGEQSGATRRMLDYYLRSAYLWCKPIARSSSHFSPDVAHEPQSVKTAETSAIGVQILETEYRNLVAATRLAVEMDNGAHAWQLTCTLLPYLSELNYGTEAETLIEQALRCARTVGSTTGESVSLMGLAHARRARGLNAQARELAAQAIELSRQDGSRAREVYQRTGLGIMYVGDNLYEEAVTCFTIALELACEIGDQLAEADLTNNLGVMHRDLGRLDEAQSYFRRTLALDESANVPGSQIVTLSNIGNVLHLQGKPRDAAVKYNEALRLSRSTGYRAGEAEALVELCASLRSRGDFAGALDLGREGLEIARSIAMQETEWAALNALGDTYLSLGDLETAEQVLRQAADLAVKHESPRFTARGHEGLAHCASARGDDTKAKHHWAEALKVYPGGVMDPAGARRHLAAPDSSTETCWRCSLMPDQD